MSSSELPYKAKEPRRVPGFFCFIMYLLAAAESAQSEDGEDLAEDDATEE